MRRILTTNRGTEVTIEAQSFDKGGEGSVHRITTSGPPNVCAKIFHSNKNLEAIERKIKYMAYNVPTNAIANNYKVCWPKDILYDNNKFVGYTMPLAFTGSQTLYNLCQGNNNKLPDNWKNKFDRYSNSGMTNRVKLCVNISAALYIIQRMNSYVIADLKPQNVMITLNGKVSIIDCDSIQISSNNNLLFPARVATPDYMPPESTKIDLQNESIPSYWDFFSMAVMYYQVFLGIHPYTASFTGKYENSNTIQSKISEGLFVHGRQKSFINTLPPPHNNYEYLPPSLKHLFIRAFEYGHVNPTSRPDTEEWGKTLYAEVEQNSIKGMKPIPTHTGRIHIETSVSNPAPAPVPHPKKVKKYLFIALLYQLIGRGIYYLDYKNKTPNKKRIYFRLFIAAILGIFLIPFDIPLISFIGDLAAFIGLITTYLIGIIETISLYVNQLNNKY
ncbi:hypothetical protein AB9P05_00410 [Roseivirga sp. BDSF3-8]|uniref:protein kinase domain-containing protein n=1 Tax=Roseivirga sp. BDSF3-8 TaxID=3241598 RepID=UPI00353278F8